MAVTADEECEMCRRYAPRIRGYGLRHLRDGTAAADLVQHVLLAVLQAVRAGTVRELDRLDAYMLGTCRYAVMDMKRGAARQQRLADELSALPEDYVGAAPAAIDRIRLEECLRALDPRDRAIVVATFVEDRDADEIGRQLDLTPGNVRVIRHRALARLQTCVQEGA